MASVPASKRKASGPSLVSRQKSHTCNGQFEEKASKRTVQVLLYCSGCQHFTKACVRSDEQISHACVSHQPHSWCQNRGNSTECMSCAHCCSRCCSFCGTSGYYLGEDKVFLRVDTTDKTQTWTSFECGEGRYKSLPCPSTFAGLVFAPTNCAAPDPESRVCHWRQTQNPYGKEQRGRSCRKASKREHIQKKI